VEQGPDRQDEDVDESGGATRPEHTGPSTGGVRIIGAETAAEITSELPVVPPAHITKDASTHASVRIIDEPGVPVEAESEGVPQSDAAHAELPHWTEPATGQVPAVLAREDDGGATGGILPPTWREEDADWTAHEEEFEPAMFSDERASLGALDETDATDEERRPWEFDLDSVQPGQPGPSSAAAPVDPITEPVPAVSRADEPEEQLFEHTAAARPEPEFTGEATVAVMAAGVTPAAKGPAPSEVVTAGDEEPESATGSTGEVPAEGVALVGDAHRPTGTARVGRVRRSGLLPARLKAKRPDDADGAVAEPLAAEPPGASVADVPGAGRRKTGLAGLAAADRLAEQVQTADPAAAPAPASAVPPAEVNADTGTDADGDGATPRSLRRRPTGDRAPRSSSNHTPDVTGGGPPPVTEPRVRRERQDGGGSTGLRVGTGVAVAVVALLAFKVGTVTSLVLCLLVVTFAAGEAFAVLRRAGWRPATLLGLVGTISLMIGAYDKGIAALPLVLVLIVAFTLLWYLFGVERGSAVAGTAATLLVVGWVAVLGSYAGLLLDPTVFPDRHGIAFLLGAIIATVANDVGALVVGRWIGSRQLAPNISPNKTWEGLAGGALASILVSTVVVGAVHPWSPANAALLGVVVAVVAPLGDLCESLLKRDLRLKDMGTVLPGHGGVLDRVDALLFVLPATYYLVRALNIG